MILKTITFPNYNDEQETEDFRFNLSKGELVKMQMAAIDERTESFQDKLEKIGKSLNGKALIEVIDEIIDVSYGVKTVDGKRFIKSPKDLEIFKSSGAYSELVVELCTDAEACAAFVNGLVPKNLRDEVNKEVAQSSHKATQGRMVTSAELRAQSEARMTGYQQKQEAPKTTVRQEAELPTVIEETAPPVLEGGLSIHEMETSPVERDQLAAFEAWKAQQAVAN